ncbi:MAG: 3-dehydroquinate dehydratase-2 [Pelagibacterales bacterium]|jgi:3-dehydroquinate dehydratase-2|nr:3-dehydroquinate dehydratase-2 [Pelagibacterales bacterium]
MVNKIIILNGPNLNLLGEREKEKYGNITLSDIENNCKQFAKKNDITLSLFQSNIEGELVEMIQKARKDQQGLIINAGGYTHTSVAIHDALKVLIVPVIELHITNIYNREEFRHKSLISKIAKGILCGFGPESYIMALQAMKNFLKK